MLRIGRFMKKIVKTFILSALSTLLACSLNVSVMANTTDPTVE